MFYSQTFLGKKSPLGTVWIAAHLERRIKKPQIESIDIPRYADYIIFNEVPIALRLSGHLLVGLAKIYSWKVNYLLQDCNRMKIDIRTVFPSAMVDLPEDADRAPFETVTRPATFQLDTLQLDFPDFDDDADNHRKTYDQITMTDQNMTEEDPYIAIILDDDYRVEPLTQSMPPIEQMDPDVMPPIDIDLEQLLGTPEKFIGAGGPGSTRVLEGSIQTPSEVRLLQENLEIEAPMQTPDKAHLVQENLEIGVPMQTPGEAPLLQENLEIDAPPIQAPNEARLHQDNLETDAPIQTPNAAQLHQENLEIEVPRNTVYDYENTLDFGNTNSDIGTTQEHSLVAKNREISPSPSVARALDTGVEYLSLPKHPNDLTIASTDDLDIPNIGQSSSALAIRPSPVLAIRPSPPAKKQKPNPRKRKQFFDESIVLSNDDMKKQLQDTSKLICKRRELPCSALEVWMFQNTCKSERALHAPLLSGMCTDLEEIFNRTYPCSRVDSSPFEHSIGTTNVLTDYEMSHRNMEPEQPDREMEPEQPDREMEPEQPDREMEPALQSVDMETDQPITDKETEQPVRDKVSEPPVGDKETEQSVIDMEIEQPRSDNANDGYTPYSDALLSEREDNTPFHAPSLRLSPIKENAFGFGIEELPSLELASAKLVDPELETPLYSDAQQHRDDFDTTGIPHLLNSSDVEDLNFLEASNASSGSEVSDISNMSTRTRAVAQYFKEHSPSTGTSEDQSGVLSLSNILKGKTRKQCARMFFETLVLKNYGFIDVHQEEAYGDVKINPTSNLSKIN